MGMKNTTDRVVYVGYGGWKSFHEGLKIVEQYFTNVIVVPYEPASGTKEQLIAKRNRVRAYLDSLEYEYLISMWNFLFLRKQDFQKATKGAINFHPCPPENPGLCCFIAPYVFNRDFHGATMHEVDEKLDNGTIYRADRFPVAGLSHLEMVNKILHFHLQHLEEACSSVLCKGEPTKNLTVDPENQQKWSDTYYSGKLEHELLDKMAPDDPIRELNCFNGKVIYEGFAHALYPCPY